MWTAGAMVAAGLTLVVLPSSGIASAEPSISTIRPAVTVLAFSLDEMNCFSSDIRLRDAGSKADTEGRDLLLASESDGGTNSIPCDRRDPKAAPKKRSRT